MLCRAFAVRQKAKDITNLLLDENRMKSQRANRKDMRDRMSGAGDRSRSTDEGGSRRETPDRRGARSVPSADRDLEAAIAASKATAEEEARRNGRGGGGGGGGGDAELEEAMRLSREEDERRKRELAANAGGGLFDEQQSQQQCVTLLRTYPRPKLILIRDRRSNNLIDIDAAPVQQQMQTGWGTFNPYAAQQQAMMEEQMRQAQMMELQRQVSLRRSCDRASFSNIDTYSQQNEQQQYLYAQQQAQLQQQYAQVRRQLVAI